jgi:PHD/YefM family antitoxin component YafN of YafNO toxin-antitoxin module
MLINIDQAKESPPMSASHPPVVHRIPITKARINLGHLAKRAHNNHEYFILEKDGIPVIGILSAAELEDYLELRDPKVREHIRKSREEYEAGKGRPLGEFLSEIAPVKKTRRSA